MASRLDPSRAGRSRTSGAGGGHPLPGGGQQGICSGSLIAPNLVMTAQHCVAEIRSPQVICGQSAFGNLYPASRST
ncbi:MAG: trypsin-like serine protease [bacterium]